MPVKPGHLRPHEQRRDFSRRFFDQDLPGKPGLGDSFLIICEGEVTEKCYFEAVRRELQLGPVEIAVVHPNRTDAVGLIEAAISRRKRSIQENNKSMSFDGFRQVSTFDHVWALFDTDVAEKQNTLGPALDLAKKEGILVGHSTPSVEVWLLIHFLNRPGAILTQREAERVLSAAWQKPYDKSRKTFCELWPDLRLRIRDAVMRSSQIRDFHASGQTKFPPNPSTELDLLVRALNSCVRPELRILRDSP